MFCVKFDLDYSNGLPVDGNHQGHMEVIGQHGRVSTKDCGSSMMIFVAIPLLLYGLSKWLSAKQHKVYRFTGIDSTVQFIFKKEQGESVTVASCGTLIAKLPRMVLARRILDAATDFFERHPLPQGDASIEDLEFGLRNFRQFLSEHEEPE